MPRLPFHLLAALAVWPLGTPAHDGHEPRFDRVQLSASADAEVTSDLFVARLFKEEQSDDQAGAANAVNQAVSRAVARAQSAGITVQTEGYRTAPVYRNRQIAGWRVRQSIQLESGDARQLAALVGDLQQSLSVESLHNVLSPRLRRDTEQGLIVQALEAFRARARLVAETLGRPGYRIVQIRVSTSPGGQPPAPVMMRSMAAESAGVAPPTIEGGRERVEVQVEGTVELTPGA